MAANYKFIISKQGLRAARDAQWGGYKIPINGFIVSNKVVSPSELETANFDYLYDNVENSGNGIVYQRIGQLSQNKDWTGTVDGLMTVRADAAEGLSVSIAFPQNLNDNDLLLNYPVQWVAGQQLNSGTFDFRTIGLLSVNEKGGKILFGTAYCTESIHKTPQNAAIGEPGNMFKLYIPIQMSNILDIVELTAEMVEYSELPIAQTESGVFGIPTNSTPYSAWHIADYCRSKKPVLALQNVNTGEETWDVFPYIKEKKITLQGTQTFADDATVGKFVGLDKSADFGDGIFRACQPNGNWQGVVGVRLNNNEILISGVYETAQNLNVGESYYLTDNGGIAPSSETTDPSKRWVRIGTAIGAYMPWVDYTKTTDFTTGMYVRNGNDANLTLYRVERDFFKTNWDNDLQYMSAQTNKLVLGIYNTSATNNETGLTRFATASEITANTANLAVAPNDLWQVYPKKGPRIEQKLNEMQSKFPNCDEIITNVWGFSETLYATAFKALWADVCEYYESDADYEPGTLMQFGGDAEITIATNEVNGIVSDVNKAAFILNKPIEQSESDAEIKKNHLPLALTGRVLIRLESSCKVKKADKLYLSTKEPGTASTENNGVCIARALESGTGKVWCATSLQV